MTKTVHLQPKLTGLGKSFAASLVSGVLGCALVAGSLALIVKIQQVLSEPESQPVILTESIQTPPAKPTPDASGSARVITAPTSPHQLSYRPTTAPDSRPTAVAAPPVNSTALVLTEEFTDEHPFIEAPPEPKKTTVRKKVVSKKKAVIAKKPSGPSEAEKARREQRRRAALAKKISKPASVIARKSPTYPRSARRKNQQGRVVVTVIVTTSGKVANPRVSKSSGHSSLDRAALAAAKKHRFRPAKNGLGQSVTSTKAIPFSFKLTS